MIDIVASPITNADASLNPLAGVDPETVCHFIVPGAPQGKGRPRVGKFGNRVQMFTPEKTVNYETLVSYCAQQQMAKTGRELYLGAARVEMHVLVGIPASWSKKKKSAALAGDIRPTSKPDIDNVEKAIYDAINGVVWKDDAQVVEVRKTKNYALTPQVCVHITAVGKE